MSEHFIPTSVSTITIILLVLDAGMKSSWDCVELFQPGQNIGFLSEEILFHPFENKLAWWFRKKQPCWKHRELKKKEQGNVKSHFPSTVWMCDHGRVGTRLVCSEWFIETQNPLFLNTASLSLLFHHRHVRLSTVTFQSHYVSCIVSSDLDTLLLLFRRAINRSFVARHGNKCIIWVVLTRRQRLGSICSRLGMEGGGVGGWQWTVSTRFSSVWCISESQFHFSSAARSEASDAKSSLRWLQ